MSEPAYAAVDWGTTSFRLWLVAETGAVLAERRTGEGMAALTRPDFAATLESHLEALGAARALRVVICGMAGARQGWFEAGYVDTPALLSSIPARAVSVSDVSRDVRILPGVAQCDRRRPDVMRGEETQLLGAFGFDPKERATICMPGTHSKWVTIDEGKVERFTTFMTGDLFSAVMRGTILTHAVANADDAEDAEAFRSAVSAAFETPALAANLLFEVRSRQLLYGGAPASARERISGTLIGLELAGGLSKDSMARGVTLIASGRLRERYMSAFDTLSVPVRGVDADETALRGLALCARSIWAI
jgi:2-dehydro-3-deoxygalactonokinase